MPKLDKQGRLLIPSDIRNVTKLATVNEVAIFYEDSKIFVTTTSDEIIDDKYIISIQAIDQKGRTYLNNNVLELLDATKNDTFVVALVKKNELICIFKK